MALIAVAAFGIISLMLVAGCNEDDIEKSLGSQTARAVEQQYEISTDPLLNEWVSNMGHIIVAHSNRQQIPYEFKVIDTDQINAFAAPYGHIYFLRGLLEFSESEDEVWFVAAHEVTHIVKRDSIKGVKKNMLYGLGAALIGGEDETMGDIVGLGAGLLLLHYSRDDERDADDGGCDLCYKAGYDPHGAIGFFDKLQALNDRGRPSSLEHLLLTHPPTPDRKSRQLSRKYFEADNAEAQLHIARGYERRHQYGHAAKLFNTALEAAPENTTARIGLADCYSAVGKLDEAREQYQSVLRENSHNQYAARRLAALPDQSVELSQVPAVQQQQARTLLQNVGSLDTAVTNMKRRSAEFSNQITGNLSSAISSSKQNSSTILGISDQNPDIEDDQRKTFMLGNAAVAKANDAVYSVEGLQRRVQNVSDHCGLLENELVSALQSAAAGTGASNDVAIARRSWLALQRATDEFDQAMDMTPDAMTKINQAQQKATDTVTYMQRMVRDSDNTWHEMNLKQAAEETENYAEMADAAIGKSKNVARLAESRALLARINIAALGANPKLREVFDGLVAHYTLCRPEEVAELREQGFGHGDAAFALAASKSTGRAAASYLTELQNNSLIDTLQQSNVDLNGPIILLRYMANAMEREMEFAEAEAAG